MLYKDFPVFLDSILSCFKNDINKEVTVDTIRDSIYGGQLDKELNHKNPSTKENLDLITEFHFDKKDYVKFGLEFLEKESFVVYDRLTDKVSITPKGFSKITTDSFSKEVSTKRVNLLLQRATWFCSILALFISVYSVFYKTNAYSFQYPSSQIHCSHVSYKLCNPKDTIKLSTPSPKKSK